MKKILSVFVIMALILSCFTIPSMASADAPSEAPSEVPLRIVTTYDFSTDDFNNTTTVKTDDCIATNEKYAYGSGYSYVRHLKIVNTGSNTPNIGFNPKNRAILKDYTTADVIALSMDMQANLKTGTFYTMLTYKKPTGAEGYKTLFQFDASNELKIASDGKDVADSDISMTYVSGQWYNISIVANKKTEKIYLLVDGVLKSTINANSEENWLEFDFANSLEYFYLDTRLRTLGAGTDEAFADNYKVYYATYEDSAYFGDVLKVAKKYDFANTNGLKQEGTTDATFTADPLSFASDSKYGSVGSLAIVNTNSDTKTAKISTDPADRKPFEGYDSADIFAYSIDINLSEFSTWNDNDGSKVNITFDNGGNRYFGPFMFRTGAKGNILQVAQSISGTNITYTELEYNKGEWYNLKFVADFKADKLYFLVNDVVYGSADCDEINADKFPTKETMLGTNSTLMITLYGDLNGTTDKIFVDNYEMLYANVPSVYSSVSYKCGDSVVANRAGITGDTLDVSVNLLNEGKNVFCVASVMYDNSELKTCDAATVTFEEGQPSAKASLKLSDLPENIADGNYSVNVFIWDADNLAPLTKGKIIMAN